MYLMTCILCLVSVRESISTTSRANVRSLQMHWQKAFCGYCGATTGNAFTIRSPLRSTGLRRGEGAGRGWLRLTLSGSGTDRNIECLKDEN